MQYEGREEGPCQDRCVNDESVPGEGQEISGPGQPGGRVLGGDPWRFEGEVFPRTQQMWGCRSPWSGERCGRGEHAQGSVKGRREAATLQPVPASAHSGPRDRVREVQNFPAGSRQGRVVQRLDTWPGLGHKTQLKTCSSELAFPRPCCRRCAEESVALAAKGDLGAVSRFLLGEGARGPPSPGPAHLSSSLGGEAAQPPADQQVPLRKARA